MTMTHDEGVLTMAHTSLHIQSHSHGTPKEGPAKEVRLRIVTLVVPSLMSNSEESSSSSTVVNVMTLGTVTKLSA